MIHWLTTLSIHTVFLYNFLLGNIYLESSQGINYYLQQLNALPAIENISSADILFKDSKLEKFQRFSEVVRDTNKLEGLFTIYRSLEEDQIYLEIQSEQLNKNYLGTVTLESGIGESGIYSGLALQDFIFYFRRVNNRIHFVIRNVNFRANSGEPEQKALTRSFSDSVLYAVPIVSISHHRKSILINLADLLMQDFAGLTPLLKNSLLTDYQLSENTSYFGTINNFFENLEINSIYNFSAHQGANLITLPDSRALTLKVHYSLSQLPENNGYIPRIADERVGYFITAYQDLSNYNSSESFVRYINRWHLEPSVTDAALSPPKKPIVFWIENAVPLEYREAIREGVLMWNKAFEKAGFLNAIQVRQMPDDADWHPADVRYNTIRWFNSIDAFFAKAPTRVNPLTGEILDADIIVDANMVRSLQPEYRTLIEGSSNKINQFFSVNNQNSCKNTNHETEVKADDNCYGIESSLQASIGATALSMLQNAELNKDKMQQYVHQYLRSLIAHEVGHALGLRHNFHGSTMLSPHELNNTEITHSKGLVSSVMDYLPVNLAPQGIAQGDYFPATIGPYDEWAIMYGYKPSNFESIEAIIPEAEKQFLEQIVGSSQQPELAYATDEDIWDINPNANVWDMSNDVLLYSQWQMDNARFMWEKLDKPDSIKEENLSHLRTVFDKILIYYLRNANLIADYIGGQTFRRNYALNVNNWVFVPTNLAKQREALARLNEYVFAKDAFNFSPQLLNQLAPSRWNHWGNYVPINRLDYPIHDRILRLQSTILRSLLDGDRLHRLLDIELKTLPGEALTIPELFDTLQNSIWTEILGIEQLKSISSIRRSLQREHLDILLGMVLRQTNVPEDGRTLAWYELKQLQKALSAKLKKSGEQLDIYTIAHLEEISDRITKTLNASLLSR
ncbi:zinc-dependent metalloprotease [Phormidium sp. LEGE 05292]|uniref:zinc-dependent metalloprotease n=1 Tax=[Phormidium] sp. LEGE 05292 TaxID=767427 RepID=UPI001882AD2C|nr:zinc-dependent metalloprotease [Phormidium sp. LEGE 05292]MBE9229221.1 zinc-dependent metalloprotease [Phormidium sp. LEGE 05292]